jgi:hemoglobin-like flavoprotein
MTAEQIRLVQTTFSMVAPISQQAAAIFYSKLFELDPSLQKLFKGDLTEQGRKLMQMIGVAVNGLNRLDDIVPVVRQLGIRHAGYGVKPEHYETVATALLWTLRQGLGAGFTPEVRDAWAAAYGVLAGTMKEAAASAAAV